MHQYSGNSFSVVLVARSCRKLLYHTAGLTWSASVELPAQRHVLLPGLRVDAHEARQHHVTERVLDDRVLIAVRREHALAARVVVADVAVRRARRAVRQLVARHPLRRVLTSLRCDARHTSQRAQVDLTTTRQ